MQAATHTAHDAARSDTRIRPPWVVWLIAGILLLSLARSILALASTGGVAPEARWLTFSVQLGVFVLLASGLWRRHPLVHRFYLVVPSLWLAFGALTLALDAASVFFRILPFEVARYLIGAGGVLPCGVSGASIASARNGC